MKFTLSKLRDDGFNALSQTCDIEANLWYGEDRMRLEHPLRQTPKA